MIGRREFIALLGGAAAGWPHAAGAQQSDQMRRIGVLMHYSQTDREGQARSAAFLDTLQRLGWTEGRNVRIEYRWSVGDAGREKAYAALQPNDLMLVLHRPLEPARKKRIAANTHERCPGCEQSQ